MRAQWMNSNDVLQQMFVWYGGIHVSLFHTF